MWKNCYQFLVCAPERSALWQTKLKNKNNKTRTLTQFMTFQQVRCGHNHILIRQRKRKAKCEFKWCTPPSMVSVLNTESKKHSIAAVTFKCDHGHQEQTRLLLQPWTFCHSYHNWFDIACTKLNAGNYWSLKYLTLIPGVRERKKRKTQQQQFLRFGNSPVISHTGHVYNIACIIIFLMP